MFSLQICMFLLQIKRIYVEGRIIYSETILIDNGSVVDKENQRLTILLIFDIDMSRNKSHINM